MILSGASGTVELLGVKRPAVAGMFYPAEAGRLRREVRAYLGDTPPGTDFPKAVIAPHAGYRYSGAVAGRVYARLRAGRGRIQRVVLVGPAHRVAVDGVAASSAGAFETPLGAVPVDREGVRTALALPFVRTADDAFAEEHSLEVHLPFLVEALGAFRVVPLLVGECDPSRMRDLLAALWGGEETVVVVSSDLSHYHDYETARAMDAATTRHIEALEPGGVGHHDACGRNGINGLLLMAKERGLAAETVDLRNSGDTAGPRDRVVGYGAWAFSDAPRQPAALPPGLRERLLDVARAALRHGLERGERLPVEAAGFPERLREPGASFVTLERGGRLRGCIGSLVATRPLVEDVADNAHGAAFRDPRFAPLEAEEMEGLSLKISVLSAPVPVAFDSEESLVAALRPGVDGLVLEAPGHRGTFLPAVWESIPQPREFLRHLKRKAGLGPDHWSPDVRVSRYTTESFS